MLFTAGPIGSTILGFGLTRDDYTAFNAGIAHTLFKGVTLDARYYGTNQSDLGEFLEDRLVVSARMSF